MIQELITNFSSGNTGGGMQNFDDDSKTSKTTGTVLYAGEGVARVGFSAGGP